MLSFVYWKLPSGATNSCPLLTAVVEMPSCRGIILTPAVQHSPTQRTRFVTPNSVNIIILIIILIQRRNNNNKNNNRNNQRGFSIIIIIKLTQNSADVLLIPIVRASAHSIISSGRSLQEVTTMPLTKKQIGRSGHFNSFVFLLRRLRLQFPHSNIGLDLRDVCTTRRQRQESQRKGESRLVVVRIDVEPLSRHTWYDSPGRCSSDCCFSSSSYCYSQCCRSSSSCGSIIMESSPMVPPTHIHLTIIIIIIMYGRRPCDTAAVRVEEALPFSSCYFTAYQWRGPRRGPGAATGWASHRLACPHPRS